MPRYLYLLRHAESTEKQLSQQEKDRELTPRGMREALRIGTYLFKESTSFDIVFCSIAERAKATAELIADAMKFDNKIIAEQDALYDASTRTLFEFITQLNDQHHKVLCIGHNPSISYLAESFTKAEIGDMPPGGLAIIKFNIHSWKEVSQGIGELQNYVFPDMMSGE
jgi:phosphohistidine phosphatase